jgi:predicted RNA-binding protein YlqC (UPF0109 family)
MNTSIDQQFVVSNPDAVVVDRRIDEKGVLLELTVDPEDLGRVIGKRGATAQSLRTLLRALGTKNDARYNLKIIDNGVPHDDRPVDETRHVDGPVAATPSLNDELGIEEDAVLAASTEHDDRLSKTRQELAELDDLDV